MSMYKKQDQEKKLSFVDISDPSFKAETLGLDPIEVNKNFHVQNGEDKSFLVGVDAFIEIWKVLPVWKRLAPIAAFAPLKWFLKIFYRLFVLIRPYLPRRDACEAGNCRI